jgi:hypothetical protein
MNLTIRWSRVDHDHELTIQPRGIVEVDLWKLTIQPRGFVEVDLWKLTTWKSAPLHAECFLGAKLITPRTRPLGAVCTWSSVYLEQCVLGAVCTWSSVYSASAHLWQFRWMPAQDTPKTAVFGECVSAV